MKYLIINWKQNKNINDVQSWVETIAESDIKKLKGFKIIIAPSFPFLYPLRDFLRSSNLDFSIAVQDVSMFEGGTHTGEVGAFQVKNVAEFAIIGHVERRKLGETDDQINKKVKQSLKYGLNPIVCFSNLHELDSLKKVCNVKNAFFVYEPADAINTTGKGNPASVEKIESMYKQSGLETIIYGGSVDKTSVHLYLNKDFISGFLVGTAGLNPTEFSHLVKSVNDPLLR